MTANRVVVWASGRNGAIGVRAIAQRDDLDLVGLWVSSDEKAGRDAGEICGIEPLGVIATRDVDALLGSKPDCVYYAGGAWRREEGLVDDLERILRAGVNVVNVSHPPLIHPRAAGHGWYERLEAACQDGGVSLYTSGVDPGLVNTLALTALGASQDVRSVRMIELIDYSTWDSPYNHSVMGFGKEDPAEALILKPGALAEMWGPAVEMVAEGMGLQVERLEEWYDVDRAKEDLELLSGPVPKGTVSALRFQIRGIVDGEVRVIAEHVNRVCATDGPEWEQGEGYRVYIDGEPNMRLDLSFSSDLGDLTHAAYIATAMPLVNAIPVVVAAAPGVLTDLDLPPRPGRILAPLAH
jgi:4-hydroxy-tetrahydrodipicolinate reductase